MLDQPKRRRSVSFSGFFSSGTLIRQREAGDRPSCAPIWFIMAIAFVRCETVPSENLEISERMWLILPS
jgi:hypothetical protein